MALLKLYLSFHYPFEDKGWRITSLLRLFPRLEILSIATDVNEPRFVDSNRAGVKLYQQNLQITLFKAVTVDDMRSLSMQFNGTRSDSCICLFGAQLATSLDSGWVRVSHITALTICPGAGIEAPSTKDGIITLGKGMRFKPASEVCVKLHEPADKQLAHSTISLVLDLARVAKHPRLSLSCGTPGLGIFNDSVSFRRLTRQEADILLRSWAWVDCRPVT
jgi:hypothetical protein